MGVAEKYELRRRANEARAEMSRAHAQWDRPGYDAAKARLDGITKEIHAHQDNCNHSWAYKGRYAGEDSYECNLCGVWKSE